MVIRPATLRDLEACRRLDGSSTSESVWNMQQASERGAISVLLSEVRLPRPLEVPYPASTEDLIPRFERGDLFLVAEDEAGTVGWLAMSEDGAGNSGRVDHLVVDWDHRRQGLGTALLREAVQEGRRRGLRAVFCSCPAKNGPAAGFYRKLGLEFCGYNEHLYAEHEIALLFAYRM